MITREEYGWVNDYRTKQYILKFSNGQYLYNCDLGMTDE